MCCKKHETNPKKINPDKALVITQNICSKQEKCIFDIRKKLKDWQLSETEQETIISSLKEDKFIDEERYADFFVRDKFRFNRWGKIKITYQLRVKEISESIIEKSISIIEQDEYQDTLEKLLAKKLKELKENDPYKLKSKLLRFAQSRGFESQLSFDMIDELLKNTIR